MAEAIDIIFQVIGLLISLSAVFIAIWSIRQVKENKSSERLDHLESRMADHEKEDAAEFSSLRSRMHSHRAVIKYLEHIPERIAVLESKNDITPKPQQFVSGEDDIDPWIKK